MLFSPHSIINQEEQKEKPIEVIHKEVENDEVWSQFKRKIPKDSSETFVYI